MANDELKAVVRDKYGKAALKVTGGAGASCCDATARAADPITSNIYGCGETAELPTEAVAASLGCGNPTALAQLDPGEVVLDLFGRRHRRAALRQARGADRQGVR